MIREILEVFKDRLAGSYLSGWILLGAGLMTGMSSPLLIGLCLIVLALTGGFILAYAE